MASCEVFPSCSLQKKWRVPAWSDRQSLRCKCALLGDFVHQLSAKCHCTHTHSLKPDLVSYKKHNETRRNPWLPPSKSPTHDQSRHDMITEWLSLSFSWRERRFFSGSLGFRAWKILDRPIWKRGTDCGRNDERDEWLESVLLETVLRRYLRLEISQPWHFDSKALVLLKGNKKRRERFQLVWLKPVLFG